MTPPEARRRGLVRAGLALAGCYLLGVALAAFLLAPAVITFLGSSRTTGHQPITLFHSLGQYRSYASALWTAHKAPDSMYAGFSILGFLVLPALFLRRRRHTSIKVMILAFGVFLLFPFFGSMLNGFAFPSYRAIFMLGLFLAAGAALLLSERTAFSGREILAMLAGLAVYVLVGFIAAGGLRPEMFAPLTMGGLMWACFACEWAIVRRRNRTVHAPEAKPRSWSPGARAAVCALIVINIGLNGAAGLNLAYSSRLKGYVPLGHVLRAFQDNAGSLASRLPGEGFYRVDKQVAVHGSELKAVASNDGLVQGYNGLDYYYSVFDRNLFTLLDGLGNRGMRKSFEYQGLDDRAALDTLLGVRYYLASVDATQYAPYGFTRASDAGKTIVYSNRFALPLAYVYHQAVPAADYARMAPLEKQQALLQGVVLDASVAPHVRRIGVRNEVLDVPYSVTTSGGATFDPVAGRFSAAKPGAQVQLHFSATPDAELYASMTGISFALQRGSKAKSASASRLKQWVRNLDGPPRQSRTALKLSFGTEGGSKAEPILSPTNNYYFGDDSALVNLGYSPKGTDAAYVRPGPAVTIDFADLKVYAVPMGRFAERVSRLATEGMRDVRYTNSSASGTVTSHGDGLLFLSIPYSKGWSATVDGIPTQVVKANVAFCGVPVTNGTHHVQMTYLTPGLVPGTALSIAALLVLLALIARQASAERSSNVATLETPVDD